MILASGTSSVMTRFVGSTTSELGAIPILHIIEAPIQTCIGIMHLLSSEDTLSKRAHNFRSFVRVRRIPWVGRISRCSRISGSSGHGGSATVDHHHRLAGDEDASGTD